MEFKLKPNYGYYALPKLAILWVVFGIIGFFLFLLNPITCFIIVGFDFYMISAYLISLMMTNPHSSTPLPEILILKGDENVLDVGCGLGKMTIGVAKHLTTGTVVGVDIWDKMEIRGNSPNRALENAKIEGVANRVRFERGNVLELKFSDDSFDFVTCASVLNNLEDKDLKTKALKEIKRVLRPGGSLLLLEPLRNLQNFFLFTPFGFPSLWNKEKWLTILKETEFREVKFVHQKGIGIFLANNS